MPVGFVILAFFVGGFFGSLAMAVAFAAYDRKEFFASMQEESPRVQLPPGDTSK